MALKQPALLIERDNRAKKKKKQNELLKTPTKKETTVKPKTTTVKREDKGNTYVDRSTISKRPQYTPKNTFVTNKDMLSSKSTFGSVNNDIRTVKTGEKKTYPKRSVATYDIYERGGKYYYNDGKKENEIDGDFVTRAIKNKKSGVIGVYDSKGKLKATDSKGNLIKKEKNILKQGAYVGKSALVNAEKGTTSIADSVLQEVQNDLQKGEKLESKNLPKQYFKALLHANPLIGGYLAGKEAKKNIKNILKDDNKNLWQKGVGSALEVLDAGTSQNFMGTKDLIQGLGSVDNSLDEKVGNIQKKIDEPVNKRLEKLDLESEKYNDATHALAKWYGIFGNMAPGIAASAITRNPNIGIAAMALSAKGQATERALQQGMDLDTATKVGTATGLVEAGTEKLTGGLKIFGKGPTGKWLTQSGITDDLIEGAIDSKIKNKGLNFIAKQGFGLTGEAGEEVLSDLAGVMIDKGTIDPNAKYTYKEFLDTVKDTFGSTFITNLLTGGYSPSAYRQNSIGVDNFNIKQQQANEVAERVNSGEIKEQEGLALLEQVKDGTYQQNRNLEQIAKQERENLIQAAQQGQITPQQYTQGLQTLANTVNQTREEINGAKEQVVEQPRLNLNEEQQNVKETMPNLSKSGLIYNDKMPTKNLKAPEGYTILYHNTTADNLESISKEGIKGSERLDAYKASPEEGEAIWASKEPQKGNGGSTVAFIVPNEVAQNSRVNNDEFMLYDNISPENIIQIDRGLKSGIQMSDLERLAKQSKNEESFVRGAVKVGLDENSAKEIYNAFGNKPVANNKEISYNDNNNTQHVTVAPYFNTPMLSSMENLDELKAEAQKPFFKKASEIAKDIGVSISDIKVNMGGYEFEGGGSVNELSYTFELPNADTTQADMFAVRLGEEGYEKQESVIALEYLDETSTNDNGIALRIKVKNLDNIAQILKEENLLNYSVEIENKVIQFVDIYDFHDADFENKIESLIRKLGDNYEKQSWRKVNSRYIDGETKQSVKEAWKRTNDLRQRSERTSGNSESKATKELDNSFSNENVITIKNDNLKGIPKDQIKGEDTGVSIDGKQVQMQIPIDSKPNKLGQYVPKDGFTQKELKSGKLGDSQFYKNATERADFIQGEVREKIKDDDYVKHYRKVTNDESMQEAFNDLNTRGTEAIADFFNKEEELTAKDTAMGWLLIEQSQANGDYDFSTQVLRKLRSNATKTAQTLQMYNYYARLTSEGMYKWCGDQLLRAEEIFEKNKSKKWIENNKNRWQLNAEETDFIKSQMERVQELNKMNDSDTTTIEIKGKKKQVSVERAKQVEIAKIQAMIENKIPPEKGQALNAWMRISMLGNLKTIGTRNPIGNIALRPINDIGDVFASAADYAISKVTGVRTKGTFNAKAQVKGFAKGGSETVQDAKLGINTRNAKGNRFEIGNGKSFNEQHTGVGKVLNPFAKAGNWMDSKVSFLLDLGDRPFYEASAQQSLENQMRLNGIEKLEDVPDWMKKIAETEGLERTYQDDNSYTQSVIAIRNAMNTFNIKGYGLGDVIIPFAKTPANLTKAIVDYSPAGFINAITKGKNLKNSIQNGQFTPEMQHAFVNQLGKATAGTILYGIGAVLAQSGLITGGEDDDKDLADFMKNTLGIQPYSIKIGDKSFTYDWAQPVASGLAIPADIKRGIQDAKEGEVDLQYIIHNAFSSGGKVLLEQSFLQGIKEVLGGYGDPIDNLMSEIEGLPARAIPTLFQQFVTFFDGTKKMSYGNKGIQNAISQAQAKTPWAKDLPVYRNSLGKEVKMYGGKNNFFNVFINPANYSEGNATESAKEIYRVYQATNNKDVLPRLVDSSLKDENGKKLTNQQKSDFLKISGNIIEENVEKMRNDKKYQDMSDDEKAEKIKAIVGYSYNKARKEITGHKLSGANKSAEKASESGYSIADYFLDKTKSTKKTSKERNRYKEMSKIGIDGTTYTEFKNFVNSDKARGESRTGGKSKRQKVIDYIQGLPLSAKQKQSLYDDWNNNQKFFTYYN